MNNRQGLIGHGTNEKTLREMLNGERGSEPWSPSDYSGMEPEYEGVDGTVFEYLEEV